MSEMQKQEGETADISVYNQDQQEKLIHILEKNYKVFNPL
jgi:hypothetical protein